MFYTIADNCILFIGFRKIKEKTMRKIKSLALLAVAALVIGCSSGSKDVEQASVNELYTKVQHHYKKVVTLKPFAI